jgi:hypothetical protein
MNMPRRKTVILSVRRIENLIPVVHMSMVYMLDGPRKSVFFSAFGGNNNSLNQNPIGFFRPSPDDASPHTP